MHSSLAQLDVKSTPALRTLSLVATGYGHTIGVASLQGASHGRSSVTQLPIPLISQSHPRVSLTSGQHEYIIEGSLRTQNTRDTANIVDYVLLG